MDGLGIGPEIQAEPGAIPGLDSRRRRIFEVLSDRSPLIAPIYLSAAAVLEERLPDRVALSAHGFREVIEKLPLDLQGLDIRLREDAVVQRAFQLKDDFDSAARGSGMRHEGKWTGFDDHLSNLLEKLEGFVEWLRSGHLTRRELAAAGLRRMDPSPAGLPAATVEADAGQWVEWSRFFTRVAHHSRDVTEEEYRDQVQAIEDLLLRRLAPRTFENQQAIDRLISEVETSADAGG